MKKLTFPLFFLVSIATNAFSQTSYYVDGATGNDKNNGLSLSKAWKTIQKACNSATPNSIVNIKAGTYYEDDTVNVSGTLGNSIVFRNYMNDSVFIDGSKSPGTTILQITDVSYITFRNITVQNLTVNNAQGILVQTSPSGKSTEITFSKMRIKDIDWTSNATTIPNDTENAQGFIAYGLNEGITNLTLDSMEVFNNILGFSEAISLDGNINVFSVTHCLVHDNNNIGIDLSGNYGVSNNPANDHIRNGIVEYNTCYNNVSLYATSGGIYADGPRDITIAYNTCYGNGYGIEVGCEQNGITDSIIVIDNLLFNNQENGLAIGGYTEATTGQVLNSVVRNNTFFMNDYAQDQSGEVYMSKATNCTFENNVFYSDSQAVMVYIDTLNPWGNITFNYNDYYTPFNDSTNVSFTWRANSYTTYGTYVSGALQDSASQFANPLLLKASLPSPNLDLKSGSPCINKGNPKTILISGETDFSGNPRISGGRIDEGAYEYQSATGINPIVSNGGIIVFPNPFNSVTTILFNNDKMHYIEITDMTGHIIETLTSTGKFYQLNRSTLAQGIYFVKVSEENNLNPAVLKIVVQ